MEILADYSDCSQIRSTASSRARYLKTSNSSSYHNVKPNTGALDRNTLCAFHTDGVCAKKEPADSDSVSIRRAVQSKLVNSQTNSFRSMERASESKQQQMRKAEAARCNAMRQREC